MNPDNTVEYNSLSWVKTQLDDVLSDAQSSLNEYIENQTDGELENCIEHLQLIYGTLQMVEVYGASMLAEEMQHTTTALLEGNIDRAEDVYDVLMRAMLQLPDYLEGIQAGKKDAPITLMPLINDLRAARKEGLLTESVLFSPDVESAVLNSDVYDAAVIEPGKLQGEVKRLRTHYQLGLLDFIRNNKERVGLQRIKAVLHALEKVSSDDEVRRIWMVVGALVEGLIKQGVDTNLSIKMLLGAVDRQLKLVLDKGEDAFAESYSKEIVKNILYYVGLCTVHSKTINAVKEAYQLDELIPQESDDSAAIGGLNADLFDTVSRGITEDLVHVKEVLELFMHSNEKDVEQLAPIVEQLAKIADTYGMLGMGAARQLLMDQRNSLDSIVKGEAEITDKTILDVASGLLNAESELKEFIDSRSGFVDMNRSNEEKSVVPAAEYREVVHTVVAEGLKNFSEAKEAILSYISGIGDKEQLDIILKRLEEVRGVSMMLPLGRVESLIERLQSYIRIALLNNNHQPDEQEQDIVADVVTSIEYFFEALSEGRPGVEQGLTAGEEAAEKLEAVYREFDELEPDVNALNDSEKIEEIEIDEELDITDDYVIEDIDLKKSDEIKPVEAATHVEEKEVAEYAILADDADEEIVEIFIEEAVEVLGELHEYLPQWKENNNDDEALAVIRRSFHTLKGSGRLLGADMIGEFSWKFENMLNRVIDNKITASDDLFSVLNEALAVLPQLVEQLKGNREPIESITHLMNSADALADGRDIPSDTNDVQQDVIEVVDDPAVLEEVIEEDLSNDDIVLVDDLLNENEIIDDDSDDILEEIDLEVVDDEDIAIEAGSLEPEIILDSVDEASNIEELDIEELDIEELDIVDLTTDILELESSAESTEELDELIEAGSDDVIELIDVGAVVGETETVDDYNIVIDEGEIDKSDDLLDIDPMLLQIYHDESQGYVANIRQLIEQSESSVQPLKADKDLIRAFHTLYGSARTAEVDSIADLSGSAEKYVKVRQESGEEDIPENVVEVFKEIEQVISGMLKKVSDGHLPSNDKVLQDKINKIVQQEIQHQLQQSWQGNSTDNSTVDVVKVSGESEDEMSVDIADLQGDVSDESESIIVDEVKEEDLSDASDSDQAALMSYGDIDDELIDIFLEEADELLENCEETLNEIKTAPNSTEHVQQLQRNMHTLKGGARMADLSPVGDLTHKLESLVVQVSENKVKADNTLFDLLQESLDSLTSMMACVKTRQPISRENELNGRIDMLMRGEVLEKRSVERFDIELIDLESDDEEELEEIDISQLLPKDDNSDTVDNIDISNQNKTAQEENNNEKQSGGERPHWGERASDVNYRDSQEQVRVRSDLLNNLVDYAGEVNIYHARMGKQITDFGFNLSELTQTVVRLKEQLRNLEIETEIQIRSGYEKESNNYDEDFDPLEMDQYSTLQQLTRSLSETAADVDSINEILADITRDSETLLVQESRISTDLQEGLMRTRMVRFGGLSSRLRRIVRQVSRELGKEVELVIEGENSEVDRTVLDRIIAPIEHILRNAVAHGIEKPEKRKAQGKAEAGNIVIHVDRQGTDVVINIKDDGRGIDTEKVREKAVQQGLVSADAKLSDHDALQFILQSGFSTADEVTQVSGRGVGMDVVDSEIKQLGGALDIDTVAGKGSDFTIRLPLTLAINQALLVSAGDDVFAVPLASIEGVVRMTGYELQRFYDSDNSLYEFNGVEFELKHLGGLLTGMQPNYSKQLQLFPVLLVRVGDQHFALHVDDMLGRREIVVKPVGLQIGAVRGIAGATILADGRVVLILEMSALVAAESLFKPHMPIEEVVKPVKDDKKTVMVVDDSITIRKITERMLKRYGIEVVLAKDGVDATGQLQDNIPDLMLLDIEMPRMDGFEVASFVRNDERLKDIPIIMITSRTGSKHKEKAMEIGVNRYLGKPFQEEDLVNNINEILQTSF